MSFFAWGFWNGAALEPASEIVTLLTASEIRPRGFRSVCFSYPMASCPNWFLKARCHGSLRFRNATGGISTMDRMVLSTQRF